jgi:hypothetical protein
LFGGQNGGGSKDNIEKKENPFSLPKIISACGTFLFLIILVVYLIIFHKRKIKYNKIILISLGLIVFLSLFTSIFFWLIKSETIRLKNSGLQEESQILPEDNLCGNSMCEPDLGETKENCAKDCTPTE